MEWTAISQLEGIAKLEGVLRIVGLPDLHAGKSPVGMALETQNIIYPHLLGNDIGCGMGLFDTGVSLDKFSEKRWVTKLNNIRELSDLPNEEECNPLPGYGTLGGGNHFAEFLKLNEVLDEKAFDDLKLQRDVICLLVHTGSRGYGQEVFQSLNYAIGLVDHSQPAQEYLEKHNKALAFAKSNREAVAKKLLNYLGYEGMPKVCIDLCHNYLEQTKDTWIHRKGAVSSEQGLVVLPGSRGSLTYIVKPTEGGEKAAFSLSHGAGRKWARNLCRSRIQGKYDKNTIRQTKQGSKVVCHDTELLFQEAPEAYKNIGHILAALLEHGLITPVASLKPLITFKG